MNRSYSIHRSSRGFVLTVRRPFRGESVAIRWDVNVQNLRALLGPLKRSGYVRTV